MKILIRNTDSKSIQLNCWSGLVPVFFFPVSCLRNINKQIVIGLKGFKFRPLCVFGLGLLRPGRVERSWEEVGEWGMKCTMIKVSWFAALWQIQCELEMLFSRVIFQRQNSFLHLTSYRRITCAVETGSFWDLFTPPHPSLVLEFVSSS